jgi:hypothetical protein
MLRNSAGLRRPAKGRKLTHIVFVSAADFGVGEIGEPFEFVRYFGQRAELGGRQRPLLNRYQFLRRFIRRAPSPCFFIRPPPRF